MQVSNGFTTLSVLDSQSDNTYFESTLSCHPSDIICIVKKITRVLALVCRVFFGDQVS
jgi:hypothetical protein